MDLIKNDTRVQVSFDFRSMNTHFIDTKLILWQARLQIYSLQTYACAGAPSAPNNRVPSEVPPVDPVPARLEPVEHECLYPNQTLWQRIRLDHMYGYWAGVANLSA